MKQILKFIKYLLMIILMIGIPFCSAWLTILAISHLQVVMGNLTAEAAAQQIKRHQDSFTGGFLVISALINGILELRYRMRNEK